MKSKRLPSIDILRAVTMLLMIFVNDLWTLSGVPEWLGHMPADTDGMGLADVVFPAFLYIVGLSVPHAIRARRSRGESNGRIIRHVAERTLALWVMGLLMVNLEYMDAGEMILRKPVWQILMALGFFLIWNDYRGRVLERIDPLTMRIGGWTLLVFLAVTYRSSGTEGWGWMQLHWWGILGLIGWGYLVGALAYLAAGRRPSWVLLIFLVSILLNINEFSSPFTSPVRIAVGASNYASVLAGVLVSSLLIRWREEGNMRYLVPFLLIYAATLMAFGYLTRPVWGISKIYGTPSWMAICAAITTLSFLLLHLLADRNGIIRRAGLLEPAGSATLTCYLVPYFVYGARTLTGWQLPAEVTTGWAGILKSIIFALLIIQLTGLLGRIHIRLKI